MPATDWIVAATASKLLTTVYQIPTLNSYPMAVAGKVIAFGSFLAGNSVACGGGSRARLPKRPSYWRCGPPL